MYDLLVLGGGPAGYAGAVRAAQLGGSVALVERDRLGGTCLNWGCIPTKALAESARLFARKDSFASFGLENAGIRFNMATAMDRKDSIVGGMVRGIGSLLRSYDIKVYKGDGQVIAPGEVQVGETRLQAPRLLIATGSVPAVPPIPGIDGPGVLTSDAILDLRPQPQRLIIIGGGVIGVEIAGIFGATGSAVTVIEALDRILPGADIELAKLMVKELASHGVKVKAGATVSRIEGRPGAMRVLIGGEGEVVEGDLVLVATGRRPNLSGLEALDLGADRAGIRTDDRMMTRLSGVAAAGDVVAGRPMLAHVAYHEATVAVENLFDHPARMDYRAVPQCIFGPVDLAQVGLTEAHAIALGHQVKVGRFPLVVNGRAQTLGETAGMIKVVAEAKHGEILGVHMLGAHAAELLGEVTLAISMEATLEELTATMHMHPTMSEGILEAALDVNQRALHLPRRRSSGH